MSFTPMLRPESATANTASAATAIRQRRSSRDGAYSKPMAGADVIDDRLPVGSLGPGMAHHPVPQVGILHVEQLIERLLFGLAGVVEAFVQPTAQQRVELAGAAAGAPAQAALIHKNPRTAPHLPPLPCGERIEERGQSCGKPSYKKLFDLSFPRAPAPHPALSPEGRGYAVSPLRGDEFLRRAPLHHQLLDLGNRLGRVQALGTGARAIHDGVAAVQLE